MTTINKQRDDSFSVTGFKNEMDKNPLGSDPSVKKVGEYIVEYYPDSIGDVERLQVYGIATEEEDHYRKWKLLADQNDFESPAHQKFRQITAEQIREIDPIL